MFHKSMKKAAVFFLLILLFHTGYLHSDLKYKRIVSLAPSITRALYELKADEALVGVTVYCPSFASNKTKIGSLLEPDMEKIISLKPDLVIGTKEGNSALTMAMLKRLKLPVYIVEAPATFKGICDQFLKLGDFIGSGQIAAKIVEDASRRVEAVKQKSRHKPKLSIFWQIGASPVYTISAKSYMNEFVVFAGCRNIFAFLPYAYPRISKESVIQARPDVIFLSAMGSDGDKEKKAWESMEGIPAVKNKKVFLLTDSIYENPSPYSIAVGLEKIFGFIYGDSEK